MDEHEAIVTAILAGDEARAESAMRLHIRHSGDAMITALETWALKPRARG